MATPLPYLSSYKNVATLFAKIAAAKQPEAFSHQFLYQTLGLKNNSDRGLIPLLRSLGFIDATGKPTAAYSLLKNSTKAPFAVADGVRLAYRPLFDANESAHSLPSDELKGLVGQIAGSDEDMTSKITGTLRALIALGNFSASAITAESQETEEVDETTTEESVVTTTKVQPPKERNAKGPLRPEFHYNIQVHLPSNGTEESYLNIFNALRKAFQ